jgi:hypothetical protein
MKDRFATLELMLAIEDKNDALIDYVKANPRLVHEYLEYNLLEALLKMEKAKLVSLTMARALSD